MRLSALSSVWWVVACPFACAGSNAVKSVPKASATTLSASAATVSIGTTDSKKRVLPPPSVSKVAPTREQLIVDLDWAKTKYPQLQSVKVKSLGSGFAQWLAIGEQIRVWVTTDGERCKRDVLMRRLDDEQAPGDVDGSGSNLSVVLLGCKPEAPDAMGRKRRNCSYNSVDPTFETSNVTVSETLIDGEFTQTLATATADPVRQHGILSDITRSAARYRGRSVQIQAVCRKGMTQCTNGAYQMCERCEPLHVTFALFNDDYYPNHEGEIQWLSPTGKLCHEPCPERGANPDQERLLGINRLGLWATSSTKAPYAGIYLNAQECWKDASALQGPETARNSERVRPPAPRKSIGD